MNREIPIYLSDSGLKQLQEGVGSGSYNTLEFRFDKVARFKHEILLNIPENRRVEITDTQFDEAWESAKGHEGLHMIKGILKQKLFNQSGNT